MKNIFLASLSLYFAQKQKCHVFNENCGSRKSPGLIIWQLNIFIIIIYMLLLLLLLWLCFPLFDSEEIECHRVQRERATAVWQTAKLPGRELNRGPRSCGLCTLPSGLLTAPPVLGSSQSIRYLLWQFTLICTWNLHIHGRNNYREISCRQLKPFTKALQLMEVNNELLLGSQIASPDVDVEE